ncbi:MULTISPECIES: hypothetical protein [Kitasatospora]|uniref:Uncharacterized protein n=1 Tax=Kitasatospora setae (strain ATCC 33774 / DSM 43861 / JCM 3304 / KCC A-0304 / NBRC 14216 / KM-6054) TaxID=452652 RepID=E4N600_KITSK|nr:MULTISPECIES: hypothetical protein [Kitasatospora]BAJ26631.1 hypothetical protein KSE_07920 [Kitasatospora setae KM-6054]
MTAGPENTPQTGENHRVQWLEHGVNVGHAVYGGIHIHSAPVPAAPSGRYPAPALPVPLPTLRTAELRSALHRLSLACAHAAQALSTAGPAPAGEESQ